MTAGGSGSVNAITAQLVDLVPQDILTDLRDEDPRSALEVYYEPLGLHELPTASLAASECAVDGFYDCSTDPRRPWIFYCPDVAQVRVRFTLLHELGHHLFATDGAHLLDDVDRLAKSARHAVQLEEAVCHRFAGTVLVPDAVLCDVIGNDSLVPQHIIAIREQTCASWEAVAVRAATWVAYRVAVCIVRQRGEVAFAATNGLTSWPRGSATKPGGPLDHALLHASRARPEEYRFGLGYAEALFCDSRPVHAQLAVAVLSPHGSNGRSAILDQPEPAWKAREDFCQWCGDERDVGWCTECSGQRCRSCERCGCGTPQNNPLCPECFQRNAFDYGSRVCVDCAS